MACNDSGSGRLPGLMGNDAVSYTHLDVYKRQVVKEGRGKKVIVYKYKRKTGYHKKNGHRQAFTQVKIEKDVYKRQAIAA